MWHLFSFFKTKPAIFLSACITGGMTVGFIKDSNQGKRFEKYIGADDKVAIVTGANTGIGYEVARELSKRGAHVYMACRNMKKCEKARDEIMLQSLNKHVYCLECDLSSQKSIREFVERFKQVEQRLDILINNAGVMRCPRLVTKEGIEMQLGVNHIGHFLLTNMLLDLLKKSAPSRIIVLSSVAHERGQINTTDLNSDKEYDPADAYNQSKLANILFTRELSKRLQDTGVTVNAVHPGLVDTELFRHMSFFKSFTGLIIKPLFWPFIKTPLSGAQTVLHAALEPELQNETGQYFVDCEKKDVSENGRDDTMAVWLWKVSEKWTRLVDK